MNPYHLLYVIELCKLIGRLHHAVTSHDDSAFVGILKLIRDLTDTAITSLSPRKRTPFRVVDDTGFYEVPDEEL